MVEEQTKELQDYLIAIRKRKIGILTIAMTVLVISAALAFLLPPVYQSSAKILIEQQDIPQELVMSTVTSYAAERIQEIEARVMTRANLMEIVEKHNLYEDERKVETTEEILARMEKDVTLEILSAEVVDPRTGRPSEATIAFSLSYDGENPQKVQRVANEIASLYLKENLISRTRQAEDASLFFQQETRRLGNLMAELGQKLAVFKTENASMLPEIQELNLQMLQRKESEISNLEARLNTLEEKRFYLTGQLGQIDPSNPAVQSAGQRLQLAEAEYASARARYSADHPDVQKLKREVDVLRREVGGADSSGAIAEQMAALRVELAQARQKYTPEHPDVIRLETKIASLNDELSYMQTRSEQDYYRSQPDNPAYITLQAQRAGVESEIKSAMQQRERLIAGIQELEASMLKAPQVEREYRALTREYDNAVSQYQETREKLSRADVARQLESESKGERFTLLEPPALPEEPVSPNRPAILALGFVLSLGSGLGFAFVADAISGAVRGARNVQRMLGAAPLAVIPYETIMTDEHKRKRFQKRSVLVGLLAIIAALLLMHFFVTPLDVLWFSFLRKFELLPS
ncbi:MAG: Wzz/FepE/Etk N-terminal domain-containing protein [Gammaproteobacteria bacterium]